MEKQRERLHDVTEAETGPRIAAHLHSVLVIDDADDTREAMEVYLRLMQGAADVRGATNGAEGLQHLRDGFLPCMIILDLRMPPHDGREFMRIRATETALSAIPLIVISDALQSEPPLTGIVGYLLKPIALDQLGALLTQRCSATQ